MDLIVKVSNGQVLSENLDEFADYVSRVMSEITTPISVSEMGVAAQQVKKLGEIEKSIDAAHKHVLEEAGRVTELLSRLEKAKKVVRDKRLELNNAVNKAKEQIKEDAIRDGIERLKMEIQDVVDSSGLPAGLYRPVIDCETVIRRAAARKKKIETMKAAINKEIADTVSACARGVNNALLIYDLIVKSGSQSAKMSAMTLLSLPLDEARERVALLKEKDEAEARAKAAEAEKAMAAAADRQPQRPSTRNDEVTPCSAEPPEQPIKTGSVNDDDVEAAEQPENYFVVVRMFCSLSQARLLARKVSGVIDGVGYVSGIDLVKD